MMKVFRLAVRSLLSIQPLFFVSNILMVSQYWSGFTATKAPHFFICLFQGRCIHRPGCSSLILKWYITCNWTLLGYWVSIFCLWTVILGGCILPFCLSYKLLHFNLLRAIHDIHSMQPNIILFINVVISQYLLCLHHFQIRRDNWLLEFISLHISLIVFFVFIN